MFVKVQRGQTIKKIRLQGAPTIEQLLAPFRCMKLIEGGSEKGYSLALDNSEVLINNDEQLQHLLARSESSGGSGTIKLRITDHSSRPTSNRTSEEYEVVPNMEVRPGGSFVRNQTNRKMSDSTHEWKARGHYHSEEVQLPSQRWFQSAHYNQSMIESEELRLQEIKAELLSSRQQLRRIESNRGTDVRSLLDFVLDPLN